MYDTTFFARKGWIDSQTKREVFSDIHPHIDLTRMCGPAPYYKLTLRESAESEPPQYFGWKDYEQQRYNMIFSWEGAVRMCFPYGIEVEEKEGKGKLVGFILEKYVSLDERE